MTDWKNELADLFEQQQQYKEEQAQTIKADSAAISAKKEQADEFLRTVVDSALLVLAKELYKHERKAYNFAGNEIFREFEVRFQDKIEFRYNINVHIGAATSTVHTGHTARYQNGSEEQGGGTIMKDGIEADIADITKDDIINDFIKIYKYIGREAPCPS